ncbi:hypothetical protein VNO77_08927 [Canavalia gladiata]|uniref:Uncharacterized protein n=1 Tax=Canavalia gladiata TaxID=3824 RepID=A0AAN9QX66_CANGL
MVSNSIQIPILDRPQSLLNGPSRLGPGFMHPETAQQGIFVNFKDLYYYNGNRLPFAAALTEQAFRNEISTRQGFSDREYSRRQMETVEG